MTAKSLALLLAFLLPPQAGHARLADVICDDSTRMIQKLSATFGAVKLGQGLRGPDAVLEVWINPGSGDWTLVQSYANGTSCIVAMGEHWESVTTSESPA